MFIKNESYKPAFSKSLEAKNKFQINERVYLSEIVRVKDKNKPLDFIAIPARVQAYRKEVIVTSEKAMIRTIYLLKSETLDEFETFLPENYLHYSMPEAYKHISLFFERFIQYIENPERKKNIEILNNILANSDIKNIKTTRQKMIDYLSSLQYKAQIISEND